MRSNARHITFDYTDSGATSIFASLSWKKKSGYLIREEMRDGSEWVGGLAKVLVCDGGSQPTERKGHRRPAYNFFFFNY